MTGQLHRMVSTSDATPNRKRGGDIRVLLSPTTVGATGGFLGVTLLEPGEQVNEHYHPYSEEFLYVAEGAIDVDLDDVPHTVPTDHALLIPIGVRHRVRNTGSGLARVVFQLCPLAPRPELGHVDTERTP